AHPLSGSFSASAQAQGSLTRSRVLVGQMTASALLTGDLELVPAANDTTVDTPGVPTLSARDTGLRATWTPIEDESTPVEYRLHYRPSSGGAWQQTSWLPQPYRTISGLTNAVEYEVKVEVRDG